MSGGSEVVFEKPTSTSTCELGSASACGFFSFFWEHNFFTKSYKDSVISHSDFLSDWLLLFPNFCLYFLGVWHHEGRGIWRSLLFPSCWQHRQGSGLNYISWVFPNIQLFFELSPTFKQASLLWLYSMLSPVSVVTWSWVCLLFPAVRTGRSKVLDSSSRRYREKRGKTAVSVLCITETTTCKKNNNKFRDVWSKAVTSVEKRWENQKPAISINHLYSRMAYWFERSY